MANIIKALKRGKRIDRKNDRRDFHTRILQHHDGEDQASDSQLVAHALDFALAGSETTATAYYRLQSRSAWKKLADEDCTTFSTYEEIDNASTQPWSHFISALNEGMRTCMNSILEAA
ncbi:hypothetical protein F5X99DRAFT_405343 [Biscogniauxia marginata]|nr:hypothetical protein F5X99DRAFT_405343 [Biscogniauxia marginata]